MDHVSKASNSEKQTSADSLKVEKFDCPRCGAKRTREFIAFPRLLAKKFGKKGEWYEHKCNIFCEQSAELEEWEAERRQHERKMLMERSGVSARLQRCSLDNFHVGDRREAYNALSSVEEWLEKWPENKENGTGLFLSGDVGVGKTHLAVALMRELQETYSTPTLMMSVPELLDDMRQEFDDENSRRGSMMDQAQKAELLVLDDLGSENVTTWSTERLFIIIDYRYREQKPTIYTSNLAISQVRSVFGPRIASRLLEANDWIFMGGQDYRKERQKDA